MMTSLSSFIAERNAERQYTLPQNYRVRLGKYKLNKNIKHHTKA